MYLSRIFLIIFATLISSVPFRGICAVTVARNVTLEREYCNGADIDFLRTVSRRINYLARLEKPVRSKEQVMIRSMSPQFRFRRAGKMLVCEIPGCSTQWKKDPQLRAGIYNLLLNSAFALPLQSGARGVPQWIVAGIDEAVRSGDNAEQIIRNNKDFFMLREMLRLYGKFPDFAALTQININDLPEAAKRCYSQQTRLMLEIFAARKTLASVLKHYNRGESADCWVRWFSSGTEAQYVLTEAALKRIWNYNFPEPPEHLSKRIYLLEKVLVPELDKNNAPGSKMVALSYKEAADMLLEKSRPDAGDIRREFVRQCRAFATTASLKNREICSRMANIALKFGVDSDAAEKYSLELARLKRQLEFDIRSRDFVNKSARVHLPVNDLYRERINAASAEADALSKRGIEYLQRIEKQYLYEY